MRMRNLLIVLVPFLSAIGCSHSPAPRAAVTAPPAGVAAGRFDAGNPVIVRIAGRTKTLTISSTAHGPVYSVSAPNGQTLLSQGTLDDLRRLHPDLYRHIRSAIVSTHAADPKEANDYLLLADRR